MSRFNKNFYNKVMGNDMKNDNSSVRNNETELSETVQPKSENEDNIAVSYQASFLESDSEQAINSNGNNVVFSKNLQPHNATDTCSANDTSQNTAFSEKTDTDLGVDAVTESNNEPKLIEIPIDEVNYAENNPFRVKDKTESGKLSIRELADSIAAFGLIHPPTVNYINGKYYLISGERRLEAIKLLGWTKVLCCVITEYNENRISGMIYSANLDVRDFTPMQMLEYCSQLQNIYKEMVKNKELTGSVREMVAERLNISERQLAKYYYVKKHLNTLTDEEKNQLDTQDLSLNKAYNIIKNRLTEDNSSPNTNVQNDNEISKGESADTDKSNIPTNNDDVVAESNHQNTEVGENTDDIDDINTINDVDNEDDVDTSPVNESHNNQVDNSDSETKTDDSDNSDSEESNITGTAHCKSIYGVYLMEDNKPILYEAEALSDGRLVYGFVFADYTNVYIAFTKTTVINVRNNGNEDIQLVVVPVKPETLKIRETKKK